LLAKELWEEISVERLERKRLVRLASAFNFGPRAGSERSVRELVSEVLRQWPGEWISKPDRDAPHEAEHLSLAINKAADVLGWKPVWDFKRAVTETIAWYRAAASGHGIDLSELTRKQIGSYSRDAAIPSSGRIEK